VALGILAICATLPGDWGRSFGQTVPFPDPGVQPTGVPAQPQAAATPGPAKSLSPAIQTLPPRPSESVGLWPVWSGDPLLVPDPAAGPRWLPLLGPSLQPPEAADVPAWWSAPCERDLNGTWFILSQQATIDDPQGSRATVRQAGSWLVVTRERDAAVYYGGCHGSRIELDAYAPASDGTLQFDGYVVGLVGDLVAGEGSAPVLHLGRVDTQGTGSEIWTRA
jgi:hypothetical protein